MVDVEQLQPELKEHSGVVRVCLPWNTSGLEAEAPLPHDSSHSPRSTEGLPTYTHTHTHTRGSV